MIRVRRRIQYILLVALLVASAIPLFNPVSAAPLASPNYRLDAQVMNNFGGQSTSGSYALLGSGGEAIVGNGAGGSYKLGIGYVPQTERSIELSLDTTAVIIPTVVPGESQSAPLNATVRTDFGGYDLSIMQNNNLTHITDPGTTIAGLSSGGTIAAPMAWNEGTTTGLGFGITGGYNVDPKWGTPPSGLHYASLPSVAASFFGKSGLSGGVEEVTNLVFRLDVPSSQKAGQYSNVVTITATARP